MREKLFKLASFVALSAGLVSCGKSIESRQAIEEDKTQALAGENFSVSCYSKNDCPDYLAYLKHESQNCNATLVQEDLLVTSASCFPNKRPALLCDEIEIVFPKNQRFQYQKLGCHQAVLASSIGKTTNGFEDSISNSKRLKPAHFLYIRISTTGRKPIQIAKNYNRELKLQSFSFDNVYSDELFFHERECFVSKSSYASPLFKPGNQAPLALTNCLGKKEEKGSPIINENGELVAIMRDFFDDDDAEKALEVVDQNNLRPVVIANRSKCLRPIKKSLSEECREELSLDEMNRSLYAMISQTIPNERVKSFHHHLEEETGVRWQLTQKERLHWSHEKAFELSLEPACRFSTRRAQNPSSIPYFRSQVRLKKGWRLDHQYTFDKTENIWDFSKLPGC